jgi:biopolymer transport protein ExbD
MRRAPRQTSEIITKVNVTPIIDVALVLVIILLVTAPMISQSDLRIDLPEARTRAAEGERNISITLRADGDLTVDRDEVPRRRLGAALRARLAEPGGSGRLVVVRADAGVAYDQVDRLLEEARAAGATRLALATRQKVEKRR